MRIFSVDVANRSSYTGSLEGQNYDMTPYPDNFGRKRLPMRTRI